MSLVNAIIMSFDHNDYNLKIPNLFFFLYNFFLLFFVSVICQFSVKLV